MPWVFRRPWTDWYRLRRPWVPSKTAVAGTIAFDAASSSGYQENQSSYSWSHTCTGSNRFLSVDVAFTGAAPPSVTGITYNGVSLSLIGVKLQEELTNCLVECWGLAAPASGANTIAVTLSASKNSVGLAVSYVGVNQSGPTEAFNSAGARNVGQPDDAVVSVTTVADNGWVHAAVATNDDPITSLQTARNSVAATGGNTSVGADEDTGPKTPAGAVSIGWTAISDTATWAIAGYAIRPTTASGQALTLSAASGSFSLAGQDAAPKVSRRLSAETGAFAESGQAASLRAGRALPADSGTFSLSGQDAGLAAAHAPLAAASGSFTLAGQDAGLHAGRVLSAGPGSFTEAGQDAALTLGRRLAADSGPYALTGQDAAFARTRVLVAAPGSFAVTGQDANLVRPGRLIAETGAFALSGQDAALRASRAMPAASGSYALSGQIAGLLAARTMPSLPGAFALAGQSAGLRAGRTLLSASGAFALAGQDALFLRLRRLAAVSGAYVLTGQAVTFIGGTPFVADHPDVLERGDFGYTIWDVGNFARTQADNGDFGYAVEDEGDAFD